MYFSSSHLLSLVSCIAAASGNANLFTYVTPGTGGVLGTFFGAPGTNATFDYVIVGGGTAGLTIATRLAEDPAISVAVVEAGGFYEVDNGNKSVVPGYANFYTGSDPSNYQPLIDWGFSTVPQAVCALHRLFLTGEENALIAVYREVPIGQSTTRVARLWVDHLLGIIWCIIGKLWSCFVNLCGQQADGAHCRPTKGSLQKWADEVGDQSYTWDNFLPYYLKSCNYTAFNPALYNSTILPQEPGNFEPTGGPLSVSFSNYADAFGTWAQKTYVSVGMTVLNSLNAGVLNGSAYSTLTIDARDGYRSSSESSFLQAAILNGTAPTIYKNTMALKVLFSGNNTATGVLVRTAGDYGTNALNFTLSARKEVIVSAGTFQSPQLLMVSGIGPQQTLAKYGIQVLKNLPGVGQNMWDHVLFGANRPVNVLTASAGLNSPITAGKLVDQFLANGSGPLAAFGAGYYGWEDLPNPYRANLSNSSIAALNTFPEDWPELEWLPISAYLGYQTNRQREDPRDGHNYATINPGIIAPLSRGNVTISSADMTDPPILDPAWLTDPTDQELAVQSFKRSREMWQYLTSQGITATPYETLPGLNVTSDRDILTYISKSFMTIYHAAGTCKMGNTSDSMAVIDSQARVYGFQGLRVVDASSFPFLPPGHPQSTIYALAEKIAADILGQSTPPPGYSMAGYYEARSNLSQARSNGIGGAAQSNDAGSMFRSPGSFMLVAIGAVSAWALYFL